MFKRIFHQLKTAMPAFAQFLRKIVPLPLPLPLPLLLLLLLPLHTACTENPFGGDNTVTGGQQEISGTVSLSDGSSPEGVVVWLQDFNLLTRADAQGKFQIILPPKPDGESSGTVSQHRLFLYLANYVLAVRQVAVLGGAFFYDRGDVDANGKLRRPVVLPRALRIVTEATPQPGNPEQIDVLVSMQSDEISCVRALNPLIGSIDKLIPVDTLGAVIIRGLDSGATTVYRSLEQAAGNEILVVCQTPLQRALSFNSAQLGLVPGRYQVVPFILVDPENVPLALLAKLGSRLNQLGNNYLRKPMRWEGGFFEVR